MQNRFQLSIRVGICGTNLVSVGAALHFSSNRTCAAKYVQKTWGTQLNAP